MAKIFDRNVNDWTKTRPANAYIEAVSSETNIIASQLLVSLKGNSGNFEQGIFNRDRSKTTFKKYLTDSLIAYGYTENWQYGKFIHEMQAGLGIEDGTRDDLDNEALVKLTTTQESIGLAIEMGLEPYEAMRRCINRMN